MKNAYSTPEAAKYIGMSVSYMRKEQLASKHGQGTKLPFVRIGRRIVYLKSDLDQFLSELKVRALSQTAEPKMKRVKPC